MSSLFLVTLTSCKSTSTTNTDSSVIASTVTTANESSATPPLITQIQRANHQMIRQHTSWIKRSATIYLNGEPAVTIEIIKSSAHPNDIIQEQEYLAYPIDTIIRLDIRMKNHSIKDFNNGSKFYRNFEITTEDNIHVDPTVQSQPDNQPETDPLEIGATGVVESYFVLDEDMKTLTFKQLILNTIIYVIYLTQIAKIFVQ